MKKITSLLVSLFLFAGLSSDLLGQGVLTANFGWSPDTACLGQATQFSDSSTGIVAVGYYIWDFGDGTTLFNLNANPTHTYTNPGTYQVYMCVFDSIRNDSACLSKTIVARACGPMTPLTTGIGGPDTICVFNAGWVQFTDSTAGGSGNYTFWWDLGNGQQTSATNPWTFYQTPGTYTIQHCAYDQWAGDTACVNKVIVVQGGNCGPPMQVNMGHWAQNYCVGGPIQFWDSVLYSSNQLHYTWDFGDGTVTNSNGFSSHVYTTPGTYVVSLCVFDTLVIGSRCGPPLTVSNIWASQDTVCPGQVIQFYDSVGGLLGNESFHWDFGDGNSSQQRYPSHAYAAAGTYTVNLCVIDTISLDTACASTSVHILFTCADTLSGYVYYDVNGNSSYDAGDLALANQAVQIFPGPVQVFTDAAGYYEEPAAPGQYIVMAPSVNSFVNTSPASGQYVHNLMGTYGNYQGDFGYDSITTNFDLRTYLYCGRARPGTTHGITIYSSNAGTQTIAGTLVLYYDSRLTFSSANSGGVHDATANTVTWNLGNLAPNAFMPSVRAYFSVPSSLAILTVLTHRAQISPTLGDLDSTNNVDVCAPVVRNSYDPNDKRVTPGEGEMGLIDGDERLQYRIRFQNTGNDTAYHVVIKDQLDPNLDLTTFQMEGASHSYRLRIDKVGEASWTFDNINLADSFVNEPASHGHLLYSAKLKPGLAPGTRVYNTANIYFDLNPAIVTNTTVTTIRDEATAIDPEGDFPGLEVYPNPTQSDFWVRFINPQGSSTRLQVLDAKGRVLQSQILETGETKLSLEGYSSGLYFYRISDDLGRSAAGKILKR